MYFYLMCHLKKIFCCLLAKESITHLKSVLYPQVEKHGYIFLYKQTTTDISNKEVKGIVLWNSMISKNLNCLLLFHYDETT